MLDNQEIKQLILRTAARDEGSAEAFERLYGLAAPLLLGVAKRIVRRHELAEEVLHDSFAKIWHAAETFDPMASQPVAWMVAFTRNRAIDVQTSHNVAKVDSYHDAVDKDPEGALDQLFDWDTTESSDDSEERRRAVQWVRECLSKLAAPERQSLVLAYEHGMSHGDLAAHLQKPLGTIKTWIRRGMGNLRSCVEAFMGATR